jgi:hypothetical protein
MSLLYAKTKRENQPTNQQPQQIQTNYTIKQDNPTQTKTKAIKKRYLLIFHRRMTSTFICRAEQ